MTEIMQLLVIDDNLKRSHDVKTILDFIGEPVTMVTCKTWQISASNCDDVVIRDRLSYFG